jgi:alpha-2-macroglobulin
LRWEATVREKGGSARDTIKIEQKVVESVPVRVFQATAVQIEKPFSTPIEKPSDALSDKGGLKVALKPKLSDDTTGLVNYMASYPYGCLEQRVSKAIALQDDALWAAVMKVLPSYLDKDGLAKYFPAMNEGSDTLTAYILSISHEAGRQIPSPVREQLEGGLARFIEGGIRRSSPMARADLTVRKLAAIEALSRNGKAKRSYLDSIEIQPSLWPTSALLDWISILQSMKDIPDRQKKLAEGEQAIRSKLNFQGTHMGFSTDQTDYLWWIMANGDVNAIRTVLLFLKEPGWKEDMPRLVRGMVGRQHQGRWHTTNANAWGRLALKKFGETFEGTPVEGTTVGSLKEEKQRVDWAAAPTGGTLSFGWPRNKQTLNVSHEGKGKPWLFLTSTAAVPLRQPFSSGYTIKKTYTAVDRKKPGSWSAGDVVRVHLDLHGQSDMTWVAVNDPIPAGASILGGGLGRDSKILTEGERQQGWVWPTFEERSFEAFRVFYQYVPKGKWSLEYTLRLNTSGTFVMPETRVEALYAPEMFGELPNGSFRIE